MLPTWVADYVGLPWRPLGRDRTGLDCYGLVRLVLAERFALTLPAYTDGYGEDVRLAEVSCQIDTNKSEWQPLEISQLRLGDTLLFRTGRLAAHVGLYLAPNTMLHIVRGVDSCVERYDRPLWNRRLLGAYRAPGLG